MKKQYKQYVTKMTDTFPEGGYSSVMKGKSNLVLAFDADDNDECPYFVEASQKIGVQTGTVKEDSDLLMPSHSFLASQTKFKPQKHPYWETFLFLGTDPDCPEDLGGTHEFWIGEGKEAERYIFSKPMACTIPPNVPHTPTVIRELHRPYVTFMVYPAPQWTCVYTNVPPAFFESPPVNKEATVNNGAKFGKYVNELNVKDVRVSAYNKGKAVPMGRYDMRTNAEAPVSVDVQLIFGSGAGFGVGDPTGFPSFPTKSAWYQTYHFFGLDKDNIGYLGGEIEFWIGEGDEAEKYVITTPTNVLIPKNTVHLPIYIRKVDKPFVMARVLATPLWAGRWVDKFPPDFKHIAPPMPDVCPVMF